MTHHVTTIDGHTVAITGPDAQGLAQKLTQKLTQRLEPVAVRYDFDGYGWKYIDSGSGSDWLKRGTSWEDHELVYGSEPKALPTLDIRPPNESGETLCKVRWMAETPHGWVGSYDKAALEQFAAPQPVQQPDAVTVNQWVPIEQAYPKDKCIDILLGDGSILCAVLPQSDGDVWWEGSGTGEKFIDPKYADVTHWRIHCDTTRHQGLRGA